MTTVFSDHYRFLAHYNRWMNRRLYDACESLSDDERKRERGAFFGSIHGTLNHLIVADQIWLRRLAQCGLDNDIRMASLNARVLDLPAGSRLNTVVFDDWKALRAKREQLDAAIESWVVEMPDVFLQLTMRYGNSRGVERTHPVWQAMTHFFNHQTHHRGQVSTLLMQAGVDVGVTDLIALV